MPGNSSKLPTSLSAMSYNVSEPEITLSPTKRCCSSMRRIRRSSTGYLSTYTYLCHVHISMSSTGYLSTYTYLCHVHISMCSAGYVNMYTYLCYVHISMSLAGYLNRVASKFYKTWRTDSIIVFYSRRRELKTDCCYVITQSESECKCLTCNQKPTGSLLHEPN